MSIWFENEVSFDEFADRYDELVELENTNQDSDDYDGYKLDSLRNIWSDINGDKIRPYGGTFYSESGFVDYIQQVIEDSYLTSQDWSKWPFRHLDVEAAADEAEGDYSAYIVNTSVGKRRFIWVPN